MEFPRSNYFPAITNVVVVLKDRHFSASYLWSFHGSEIKRMFVKI